MSALAWSAFYLLLGFGFAFGSEIGDGRDAAAPWPPYRLLCIILGIILWPIGIMTLLTIVLTKAAK